MTNQRYRKEPIDQVLHVPMRTLLAAVVGLSMGLTAGLAPHVALAASPGANAAGKTYATDATDASYATGTAVTPASALVLSTTDGHMEMNDGAQIVSRPVVPDRLSLIDVNANPPRVVSSVAVPTALIGPPMNTWVAPDASFAIVVSATRAAAGPAGAPRDVSDDRVSVVALNAGEAGIDAGQPREGGAPSAASWQPHVVQALRAGAGASSVAVSPNGRVALVTNRDAGTVSVYQLSEQRLIPAGTVRLDPAFDGADLLGQPAGKPAGPGPAGVVFASDDRALVTRGYDNQVSVLDIANNGGTNAGPGTGMGTPSVTVERQTLTTGVSPYTIDVNPQRTLAAVSNMGRADSDGSTDTVSLIDLTQQPYRVVYTQTVASGPEPLKFSPDGQWLAVGASNGSVEPAASHFHRDNGLLQLFRVDGQRLILADTAPVGHGPEGVAFSPDGRRIVVQAMVEKQLQVFDWNGNVLTQRAILPAPGVPSSLAIVSPASPSNGVHIAAAR